MIKALRRYFWGILAAVGLLGLALVGLGTWWRNRKVRRVLGRAAVEIGDEHVRTTATLADRDSEAARTEAHGAVNAEAGRVAGEVISNGQSLSDFLRDRGATGR